MSEGSELDIAYKKAIIQLAQQMPQIIEAMNNLANAINLMPRSLRFHP